MTRMIVVGVCLLAAIGCKSENELRYTSTLLAETQGVALSDDGLESFAAMAGTTCTIDTNWGCPTADEDLPSEDEKIVDHYQGQTLGVSNTGLHFVDALGWDAASDWELHGVKTARLTDVGAVVLAGDEAGCSLTLPDGTSSSVPEAACADGLRVDVDRASGALLIATQVGVLHLDGNGATIMNDEHDLAAWDEVLGYVYVANEGGTLLSALDRTGESVWTTETGGVITDIATRGDKADVIVLAEDDSGFGLIERYDGATGKLRSSSRVPSAEGDVEVSSNGRAIAVIRPTEVQYYEIMVTGEEQPIATDVDKECIEPPTRETRD